MRFFKSHDLRLEGSRFFFLVDHLLFPPLIHFIPLSLIALPIKLDRGGNLCTTNSGRNRGVPSLKARIHSDSTVKAGTVKGYPGLMSIPVSRDAPRRETSHQLISLKSSPCKLTKIWSMHNCIVANSPPRILVRKLIYHDAESPVGRSADGINWSFSCLPLLYNRRLGIFAF